MIANMKPNKIGTIDRNRKVLFGRFLNIKKDIIEIAKSPKEI